VKHENAIPALSRNGKARSLFSISRGGSMSKSLLWTFITLLISSSLFAQTELEPIDIQSTHHSLLPFYGGRIWSAPATLLREGGGVEDILRQAPGVGYAQNGGFGGRGSVFLRGSESRHTLFAVEGLKLNDPSNTDRHFDTGFLFPVFYENLLVLKGPSPVLYGGDATSGVIDLIPRRGHSSPQTIMGLSAGSFQSFQLHALQDWRSEAARGSLGLAHARSDGFSRLNKKRFGATENDGYELNQFFSSSRHYWSPVWSSDLFLYGTLGEAEQDGFGMDQTRDKTTNQTFSVMQSTQRKTSFGSYWVKAGLHSVNRDIIATGPNDEVYLGQNRQAQLGVLLKHSTGETLAGVGAEQEWIGLSNFSAQNDLFHLFLLQKNRWEDWQLIYGGRIEHHQRFGDFHAWEIGLSRTFASPLEAFFKCTRGYKNPSLYQLYGPPVSGNPVGNINLKPELNHSCELGLEWKERYEWSVVLFQQTFENLIQYTNVGYKNQGDLKINGVETLIRTPEMWLGQWQWQATYLDFSEYQSRPLRRAPFTHQVSWIYHWKHFSSETVLRTAGRRSDLDNNSTAVRLASYEVLDWILRFSPDSSQQWTFKLANVTDRWYEEVWGYNVMPRSVNLSWNKQFQ
jgi:vitamin B12 transporter